MPLPVQLTDDAAQDLAAIIQYVARHDAPGKAAHLLDRFEKVLNNLAEYPDRGVYPRELLKLGIREYREAFFKPYRMIYRVREEAVYVYLIVDGRRDMQTLLQQRLLGA